MGRTKTINRKYRVKKRGQTMKKRGVRKPSRQSRYGKKSTARSQSTAKSQSRTSRARKQGRYSRKTNVRRRTNTRRTKKMIGGTGGEPVSFALRFKRDRENWIYQQMYAVWQSSRFRKKNKTYFTIQGVQTVLQRGDGRPKQYLEFSLPCKQTLAGLKLENNEFLYEISPKENNEATTSIVVQKNKIDGVETTGKLITDVERDGLYEKLYRNNNNLPHPTKTPLGFAGEILVFNETYEKIQDKIKSTGAPKYRLDGSYLEEKSRHEDFKNTFNKITGVSTPNQGECLRDVDEIVSSFNQGKEVHGPSLARRGHVPVFGLAGETKIDSNDRFAALLSNLEEFAKKGPEEISRMLDTLREEGNDRKPEPKVDGKPINPLIKRDNVSEFRYGDIRPSQNSGIVKSGEIITEQISKKTKAEINFLPLLQDIETTQKEVIRRNPKFKQLEKFIEEAKSEPNRFFNADMVKLRFSGDGSTVPDFIAVSCPVDRNAPEGLTDEEDLDAKKRQHPIWKEIIEQYGVDTIIKLTGDVENGRSKCYPYHTSLHTPGGHEMETEEMEGVTIYSPYVNGKKVNIHHFKAWPDHGVPLDDAKNKLIKLVMAVKDKMSAKKPIIVHCSAGVGRTGTFILMVYILKMLESFGQGDQNIEGPFGLNFDTSQLKSNLVKVILDVLLYLLRTFRKISVQTKEQEKYLYSYINSFLAGANPYGVSLGVNAGESRTEKVTFKFYNDGTQIVIYGEGEKEQRLEVMIQVDGVGAKIIFEELLYQTPAHGIPPKKLGEVEVKGLITQSDGISTISDIQNSEVIMEIINLIDQQPLEGEDLDGPLPKLPRSTLPGAPGMDTSGLSVLNEDHKRTNVR